MSKLTIFCKSYRGDFERLSTLLNSYRKYNRDNIPFYLCVPKKDKDFLNFNISDINLIYDEDLYTFKYKLDGWRQQQIIKHFFHRICPSDNFLIIDSDCRFIKDFFIDDFIAYSNVPYTVCHTSELGSTYDVNISNKSLEIEKSGYQRVMFLYRKILGGKGKKRYNSGPNPQVWSKKVCDSLDKMLAYNNTDYEKFQIDFEINTGLQFREAVLYLEWFLICKEVPLFPTGPLMKLYNNQKILDFETDQGWSKLDKLKQQYIGIVYQSKNIDLSSIS